MDAKEKPCKICGSIFTPRQYNHNVCSSQCRKIAMQENRENAKRLQEYKYKQYNHICEECGNKYISNNPRQKRCSDACRKKHTERWKVSMRRMPRPREINCIACGEKITTFSANKKFCSEDCREGWYSKSDRVCDDCQETFTGSRVAKYCHGCRDKRSHGYDSLPTVVPEIRIKTAEYNERMVNYWHIPGFTKTLRESVLERDGHECYICKKKTQLHIHHIIPRKDGGKHEAENLVTLCSGCHRTIEHGDTENAILKCSMRAMQEVCMP